MKYEPLARFLSQQKQASIPMTFAQIEQLIGNRLPASARKHRPWWSNNPSNSVITRAWLDAGFKTTQVDMAGERLVFMRVTPVETPASGNTLVLRRRLFGALSGMVRHTDPDALSGPTGERWSAESGSGA